jgi:NAD(P)-dependent dehydrogenase (short-subunit alcohol dehydrogenase family)
MDNFFSLKGKTILVTGASSGIGRGIATQCSKMGARLVITGRNEQKLGETLQLLDGEGHLVIAADLVNQEGIDGLVQECPELNGYVHSAGVLNLCTTRTVNRQNLEQSINTNTIAPIMITNGLLRKKKLKSQSSVVYISSLSGVLIGGTGEISYSATKGALSGYMKTAALELASRRIRVNAICPALVPTDLSRQYHEIVPEEILKAEIPTKYPLGRMGTTDDVANAAIFLLSEASSWITGINLVLDGGLTLR